MPTMNQTIDEKLLEAQVAITNAADPEIAQPLALFGYDADRIAEGQALYETANDLHQKQGREYGDQFAATDTLQKKLEEAKATYMRHVKIARIALKNERGIMQTLDLEGRRKFTLAGFISQARQFYTNALGDNTVIEKMLKFGIASEQLEAGKALVDATEAAKAAREKERGEAQQATVDRDEAMEALAEWLSDFFAIARIALEDKPQLLEKLGIVKAS